MVYIKEIFPYFFIALQKQFAAGDLLYLQHDVSTLTVII